MALTTFANKIFKINHAVGYPMIVCAEQYDEVEIVLVDNPLTGKKVLDSIKLTSTNAASEYVDVWKNATGLAYDVLLDQITGFIVTKAEFDAPNNKYLYVDRKFCMSLSGDPGELLTRLNCYVSKRLTSGGTDPDDGSWAGDVD